jgi:hypothetical protein
MLAHLVTAVYGLQAEFRGFGSKTQQTALGTGIPEADNDDLLLLRNNESSLTVAPGSAVCA